METKNAPGHKTEGALVHFSGLNGSVYNTAPASRKVEAA